MSTTTSGRSVDVRDRSNRRLSTETRAAFKTTEFIAYVCSVIAVAVAAQVIGDNGAGKGDYFRADKAFLYITILTVGYMISRGLAKAGSREFYDDKDDTHQH